MRKRKGAIMNNDILKESPPIRILIQTTSQNPKALEVEITQSVAEKLKDGPKNIFGETEVPYKALIPSFSGVKRADIVCFNDGEMEVLEFKPFDQHKIKDLSVPNAIRMVREDIKKLEYSSSKTKLLSQWSLKASCKAGI